MKKQEFDNLVESVRQAGRIRRREKQPRRVVDRVRVIVARELPREAYNAPLHLFSASPELVGFGSRTYRRHSQFTSQVLEGLFDRLQREGFIMSYTMEDFIRDYNRKRFLELPPKKQQEILASMPLERRLAGLGPEQRLAGLSVDQIQQYLDQLKAGRAAQPRKPRRKR